MTELFLVFVVAAGSWFKIEKINVYRNGEYACKKYAESYGSDDVWRISLLKLKAEKVTCKPGCWTVDVSGSTDTSIR